MKRITTLVCHLLTALTLLLASHVTRAAEPATSPREIKILGIGNSFTVNAFSLLRPISAQSKDCRLTLGGATIGGCPMEKHIRLAKLHEADPNDPEGKPYSLTTTDENGKTTRSRVGLREMLKSDDWDFVTIQQLSAQSPDVDNYRPYAKELYDYIKKYAPNTEVVMHQTWAYRVDGDFDRVFRGKPNYGQEEMYRDLDKAYRTIAAELDVRLIRVGAAFQLARQVRPFVPDTSTDLSTLSPPALPQEKNSLCAGYRWDRSTPPKLGCDTHHASLQGQYLAACVWFEFFTGQNSYAEGIRIDRISDEDAKFLSGIAHQVVAEGKRPKVKP